jgi:hypothetical protein
VTEPETTGERLRRPVRQIGGLLDEPARVTVWAIAAFSDLAAVAVGLNVVEHLVVGRAVRSEATQS